MAIGGLLGEASGSFSALAGDRLLDSIQASYDRATMGVNLIGQLRSPAHIYESPLKLTIRKELQYEIDQWLKDV